MKFFSFLLLIGLALFLPTAVYSQETIDQVTSFHSHITINSDTSIAIVETINYQTNLQKHGLYRYIPIKYSRNGLIYTAKITAVSVFDANNHPVPFDSSVKSGNLVLKIGDPDKTFTGDQTFIVSYSVDNALKRHPNHHELYWDITGDGWQVPVLASLATISSEYADITKIDCFSGPYGFDDNLCSFEFDNSTAEFSYNQPIAYNDNFTVVIALDPSSQIQFPNSAQLFLKAVVDNLPLLFILIPSFAMLLVWFYQGRDYIFLSANVFHTDESKPKRLRSLFMGRTPFVYEPLDLTPGEAGTIVDEKVNDRDIIAEIIELAHKRYLEIKQLKKKYWFNKNDFQLNLLKSADANLPAHQSYLLKAIFGSNKTIKVSQLKGKFYQKMAKTKDLIVDSLNQQSLFTKHPKKARASYALLFFCFVVAIWILSGLFSRFWFSFAQQDFYKAILLIQLFFGSWLVYHMPQKTAVGTNLMLQAKGLKQTIKRGKWRETIKEKNLFIEEILPFAVAFGVVDKLTRDMKDLSLLPPNYFAASGITSRNFNSFVHNFSAASTANLSYNPNSSRSSGGSGFSGGSSGGGGGGGGGGSW